MVNEAGRNSLLRMLTLRPDDGVKGSVTCGEVLTEGKVVGGWGGLNTGWGGLNDGSGGLNDG
jgi:hypothetical protein